MLPKSSEDLFKFQLSPTKRCIYSIFFSVNMTGNPSYTESTRSTLLTFAFHRITVMKHSSPAEQLPFFLSFQKTIAFFVRVTGKWRSWIRYEKMNPAINGQKRRHSEPVKNFRNLIFQLEFRNVKVFRYSPPAIYKSHKSQDDWLT